MGVVQVVHPSGLRVTVKPPPSLARWWCVHRVARLSAEVAPSGKGTVCYPVCLILAGGVADGCRVGATSRGRRRYQELPLILPRPPSLSVVRLTLVSTEEERWRRRSVWLWPVG